MRERDWHWFSEGEANTKSTALPLSLYNLAETVNTRGRPSRSVKWTWHKLDWQADTQVPSLSGFSGSVSFALSFHPSECAKSNIFCNISEALRLCVRENRWWALHSPASSARLPLPDSWSPPPSYLCRCWCSSALFAPLTKHLLSFFLTTSLTHMHCSYRLSWKLRGKCVQNRVENTLKLSVEYFTSNAFASSLQRCLLLSPASLQTSTSSNLCPFSWLTIDSWFQNFTKRRKSIPLNSDLDLVKEGVKKAVLPFGPKDTSRYFLNKSTILPLKGIV